MDCGERLKYFIDNNFNSIKIFCDSTQIDQSLISRYCKDVHFPSGEALKSFYLVGLSIDWLISGNGDKFADNPEGQKLKLEYESKTPANPVKDIKKRIKQWIIDNYNSIDEFVQENDISSTDILNELESSTLPDPNFITCLQNAGCDIKWILGDDGNSYSNTPEGFIKQIKKESNLSTIKYTPSNDMEDFIKRIEEAITRIFEKKINKMIGDNYDEL